MKWSKEPKQPGIRGLKSYVFRAVYTDVDAYFYQELVQKLKAELPDIHIHAFSPMEILYGAEQAGISIKDELEMLKEAGLNSILAMPLRY